MSVAVVSGVPWAKHPKVFWSGYPSGSVLLLWRLNWEWEGEGKKRWKMSELISFWKTSCMLAGYSYLYQNYLNFFLCFGSWAWILWFGDMCSLNVEAELCWFSCYCTSLWLAGINLIPLCICVWFFWPLYRWDAASKSSKRASSTGTA